VDIISIELAIIIFLLTVISLILYSLSIEKTPTGIRSHLTHENHDLIPLFPSDPNSKV